jgi:hypothetical protein
MSTASANSFNGPRQPISTLSLRLANSRTSVDSSSPASPWFRNEDATWWDDCLANGYICVGWDDVGDLGQYETVDGLRAALETTYYEANKGVAAQKAQLWTLTSCRPETSSLQTTHTHAAGTAELVLCQQGRALVGPQMREFELELNDALWFPSDLPHFRSSPLGPRHSTTCYSRPR